MTKNTSKNCHCYLVLFHLLFVIGCYYWYCLFVMLLFCWYCVLLLLLCYCWYVIGFEEGRKLPFVVAYQLNYERNALLLLVFFVICYFVILVFWYFVLLHCYYYVIVVGMLLEEGEVGELRKEGNFPL